MGPGDEQAAEERRRLGREYLARRNMEMSVLQQKRGISSPSAEEPPSPTSFDSMVDGDGKLRLGGELLPEVPSAELSTEPEPEMKQLHQPTPVAEASSSTSNAGGWGWQLGAALANPFGDEFELERSITPKPPVPPKISLGSRPQPEQTPPVAEPQQHEPETRHEELTYEEQMAIALSLSESETSKPSATVRQNSQEEHDDDLRAAIEASLRDMDGQQAAHAIAHAVPVTPRLNGNSKQPLVDLTPDPPISTPQDLPRGDWTSLFDHSVWSQEEKTVDPPISVPPQAVGADEDDLYSVTPQLTRARLAVHDSEQTRPRAVVATKPYDPVHEAASAQQQQAPLEASFYSAQSRSTSPPTSHTMSNSPAPPQLVNIAEDAIFAAMGLAPTNHSHTTSNAPAPLPPANTAEATLGAAMGYAPTNNSQVSSILLGSTSSSEAFASLPAMSRSQTPPQHTASVAHSEMSDVEVIDVLEDSDVDMLSEEGDGVATPDSWTEVGSQDGESEAGHHEAAAAALSS